MTSTSTTTAAPPPPPVTRSHQLDIQFRLDDTTYRAIANVGIGAYGVVCKAIDTRRPNVTVAIKKIPHAFTALTLVKRTLREVRILRDLRHENIIAVIDMFRASTDSGDDAYLVMDLMETDLHQIIHSRQHLMDEHYQYFLYQTLRGLKVRLPTSSAFTVSTNNCIIFCSCSICQYLYHLLFLQYLPISVSSSPFIVSTRGRHRTSRSQTEVDSTNPR